MTATLASPARDDRAAVDKAISLLVALGDRAGGGMGVSELARRARLSKSTAFRVLGLLERNGVVERVGTDYRLGERLHHLGRSVYAPESEGVRDRLLPFLADLYEASRETVHLAVLDGSHVIYLAKLYGHRPAPVPSRIGGRLPAHATAVGKVLLAYDSDAAEQALSRPLERYTAHTIADPGDLAAELNRIRRTGVAFDHAEYQPGLACVAAPVLGRGGRAVAALSVAGRQGRIDTERLGARARLVAAEASRAWSRQVQRAYLA
ncbi:IclR family transcriptional regulator [Streptomyces jumonjinensis]|uniref:IclR family transcriptional regulator n=1 Tax=Streptomyces jumonjinensis TaxID=1945 RepID=A0A646KM54_STRJU|nr:IclR family transcriptional regulator [Streptomyces jumonjinensis]MQT02056.1 IclR family transcriptional regulator [Streptomyces jumonjinensis]